MAAAAAQLLASGGSARLVDSFRAQHPGVVGYTYYSYRFAARAKGNGWRLDYFLVGGWSVRWGWDSRLHWDRGAERAPVPNARQRRGGVPAVSAGGAW